MSFDFDKEIPRHGTGSLKFDKYRDTDVLPMWVADMDFASPPCILEAIRKRVDHEILGYSRPHPGLNDAIVEYLERKHAATIDPEWIVWLSGCVPALSMACGAAGQGGDAVITSSPVYPPFLWVHLDFKRQSICVPMQPDADGIYHFDFDAMEAAVTPETKVFLLCNPHNPVGRVFTREEMAQVAAFCEKHGLLLCSDEIHCDMIFDEEKTPHISALTLTGALRENTITLLAASKTYNIAGLANAFAVIPNADLRRRFTKVSGRLNPEISPLSFHATEAAYRHGEPWRTELMAYLRGNYELIRSAVESRLAPLKLTPMEATYLAWLDARELGLDDPVGHFEKHGVGFSDGRDFGAPGFVRLNFGCTRATLEKALSRAESALA